MTHTCREWQRTECETNMEGEGTGTNRDSLVTDSRNWINRLIVLAEISAPSALVQLLSLGTHGVALRC